MKPKNNHYAYRITNRANGMHYYGVRSCHCLPKDDLGIKYFSSSKPLRADIAKLGVSQFKFKIVRTFKDRASADQFEIDVHARFNVSASPKFYNKANRTSRAFTAYGSKARVGIRHTKESREKMALSQMGKKQTKEVCDGRSARMKELWADPAYKAKQSAMRKNLWLDPVFRAEHLTDGSYLPSRAGIYVDEATRRKISEKAKGRSQSAAHVAKRMSSRKEVETTRYIVKMLTALNQETNPSYSWENGY